MQVGRRGGTGKACTLRGGEFHSSLAVYGGINVLYVHTTLQVPYQSTI